MLNGVFFAALILYFVATVLELGGMVFKKKNITRLAWWLFVAGAVCNTAYLVARGAIAGRLPLSNQFEFSTAFAWGIAVMLIGLQTKSKAEWMRAAAMPMAFLILSYAALQPREITDLMPALKSAWFGLHIGSIHDVVMQECEVVEYLHRHRRGHSLLNTTTEGLGGDE